MDTSERKEVRKEKVKDMYNPGTQKPEMSSLSLNNSAISTGLMAGAIMGAYLLLVNLLTDGSFGVAKYFQYVILAGFIYMALGRNRRAEREGKVFQHGMVVGAFVSVFSAIALIVIDLLVSAIAPAMAFRQFDQETVSATEHLASGFGMALEVFVFGMIATFIFLQSKKVSSQSE